ncbi:MAG: recombination protein RecR [Pseudomonadota bacterium]
MKTTRAFDTLVQALQALPTIGPKTAMRLASHVLQHDRPAAQVLASSLLNALNQLHNCCRCNSFTESIDEYPVCTICADFERDATLLCVVDSIADQHAVEQSLGYKGLYFVLMGRLSPLDGMGVANIALRALLARASEPQVKEVILANRFSADGEATAYIIAKHIKPLGKTVTRLSKGVPVGIELEYIDLPTLAHALRARR